MDDLKSRAARFAESWAGRGDEKSDTQQYWRDLLDKVLLIPDTSDRQTLWFERRTALDGFIDALMIQARVLVEQKSLGVDLDRPEPRQGTMVTPVEQAKRYSDSLPPSERPSVLITCNFGTFRLYDLEADPLARTPQSEFTLADLPEWFTARYPEGKPNAAKLLLGDKPEDTRIALIYRISDPQPLADGDVLGVDLGQHSLYMDSRGGEAPYARVQGAKRRYAHNRKTLQEKGTRSAHRRLKAMKQREERFIRDVNHQASKRLVNTQGVQAIAFEDLTYIRRQASKRTKTGARRRNMLNQWSFSQLQEFTAYKAARNGIRILMVDPSYTSQRCNRCGYVDARNRNGARFDCRRCGWSDNADHNAAMNIRDRALSSLAEEEHTSTDRPVDRSQSTDHDGWSAHDDLPTPTGQGRVMGTTLTSKPRCSSSR